MTNTLLPTRFLFRFSAPCRYRDPLWMAHGAQLDDKHRLIGLAELEQAEKGTGPICAQHPKGRSGKLDLSPFLPWANVRAAWSEAGLAFSVHVQGKRQPPWCRAGRTEDSDGLQVWIDTRNVHNVHRAGRFCHRFVFLPLGGDRKLDQPVADVLAINRARELPKPVREGLLKVQSHKRADGYVLDTLIPAEALTGFDPTEHPRLGFTYAVVDRELGEQTFSVGKPMPYHNDPSLWATLELAK